MAPNLLEKENSSVFFKFKSTPSRKLVHFSFSIKIRFFQDLACCQLDFKISSDLWPERPSDSVPSIFRRRKILPLAGRRKRDHGGKVGKRIRMARHSNTAASPPIDSSAVIVIDGETDEQRLPLKKRHHHMQRDGGGGGKQQHLDEIEIEIEIGTVSPVKIASSTSVVSATAMKEMEEGGLGQAAARSVEGLYRATMKPTDILSPSKMPPHRPVDSGNFYTLPYKNA